MSGGLALVAHWGIVERLLANTAWWGRSSRKALPRFGVLTLLAAVCALMMLVGLEQAMKAGIEPDIAATRMFRQTGFALPFSGGWLLLRRDLAIRPLASRGVPPAKLVLILTGPPATDHPVMVSLLQDSLPEGYVLTVQKTGERQSYSVELATSPMIARTRGTAATE